MNSKAQNKVSSSLQTVALSSSGWKLSCSTYFSILSMGSCMPLPLLACPQGLHTDRSRHKSFGCRCLIQHQRSSNYHYSALAKSHSTHDFEFGRQLGSHPYLTESLLFQKIRYHSPQSESLPPLIRGF